ncbi:hypothetical protein CXF45_10010, partial [Corynebacterium bovis]
QTVMRSINTSLFSIVPIASLLVVAVWLMGVGTLKDLALVQLIGVIAGTFSSIFLASPLLVTLKSVQKAYREHDAKVARARELAASGAGPLGRADVSGDRPADGAATATAGEPGTGAATAVDPAATAAADRGAVVARSSSVLTSGTDGDAPAGDPTVTDDTTPGDGAGTARRTVRPPSTPTTDSGRSWRPGM